MKVEISKFKILHPFCNFGVLKVIFKFSLATSYFHLAIHSMYIYIIHTARSEIIIKHPFSAFCPQD